MTTQNLKPKFHLKAAKRQTTLSRWPTAPSCGMRLLGLTLLALSGAWGFAPSPAPSGRFATAFRVASRTADVAVHASNANELIPLRQGSTVALITPMTSTGDIDVPGLRKLLQFHVEAGTDNFCILGTTGEASVMSMEERALVLTTAVEEVKGRVPIMAGTGTINPIAVKAMTQQAIDLGCDASLVASPYYVKPPQRGLVKHFNTMADMGLPVVIYNIPGRAAIDMKDENIAICAEHEHIVGLKDATGDLSRVESMRNLAGKEFLLYSGDDNTSLEFVSRGGDGCISVTANLVPDIMHRIMKAALAGETSEAQALNDEIKELHTKLFVETSPIPAKWASKRIGMIETAYCRPPLDELDPEFESVVEQALKEAGLLS